MKKFISELIRTLIFTIYVTVSLFLLFSLYKQGKADNAIIYEKNRISLSGTVSIDDKDWIGLPDALALEDFRKSLIFSGHFDTDITEGDSLIYLPNQLKIEIFVNGTLKLSTGQTESLPSFIRYAGSSYQYRNLGEIKKEDQIVITLTKAYNQQSMHSIPLFFNNLFVASEGELFRNIIRNCSIHPLVGIGVFLFGFNFLIVTLIQQLSSIHYLKRIFYLCFLCISGGICYLSESVYGFIDLLFPHPVFNTLIYYGCFPMFLCFLLLYTFEYINAPRKKRLLKYLLMLYATFTLSAFLLQATGIIDLYLMYKPLVITGTVFLFIVFICLLFETKQNKTKEFRYILGSTGALLISLLLKSRLLLLWNINDHSYLRIGILLCYLILLFNKMKAMKQNIQLLKEQDEMKEELQKARTAIMLSQIKPHFLFNTLNVIHHICSKDSALASTALLHFSHYLRGNMDSLTKEELIPFEQELDHINHYVYMEKLRFLDRVTIHYDLKVTNFSIPTLTLQPLVENAIRHGITKKVEGGTVTIKTLETKNEIIIIVSDDGIGFQTDVLQETRRSHIGLSNVKKRLHLQSKGSLHVKSTPGVGTAVTITLPKIGGHTDESNGC